MLDRVLCRQHEKGLLERERGISDRDLTLLHGFEEGCLNLGGGPIDFVREDQVRKNGTLLDAVGRLSWIEDFRPNDVRGKHVRRKLNPGEARIDRLSEGANREGLRETRNALDQDMASSQQTDQEARDHRFLTHENLRHFVREFAAKLRGLLPTDLQNLQTSCLLVDVHLSLLPAPAAHPELGCGSAPSFPHPAARSRFGPPRIAK